MTQKLWFQKKYVNKFKGINSRIDEIQAAFLNVKLLLKKFTKERNLIAKYYNSNIPDLEDLILPYQAPQSYSVFHLYVIRTSKEIHCKNI